MDRYFRAACRAILALEARQKQWQDSVSQDAEARMEAGAGHPVDLIDCIDDHEVKTAMDVASALEDLHHALNKAEEFFVRIEPDRGTLARLSRLAAN
jgi:hypothetical protein